ncbi:DNA gyrase subunit A [Candidatus Falkowbacteria bacterium RBG_13_39_14]|uniref:DNA gyrase subunit A n=1 Tax=Candidatus Falkowbacteria bacterium RBG_13_39_14 TaxID=1797985 RepID=A0A1F5S7X9_9BACT|nr:MAG: DNA gyrase subunit A [Candidatus Falkowbacteria bacterium RBG_13_39_14]
MAQEKPINNIGKLEETNIGGEMKASYLDYAMSVIVSRALPDVRDGLKPVHRRILYAMWSIGLRSNAKFRKSATVVGEVLGKYHPHGDVAVYDSMVRMAQFFSMRYMLVNGQGNFGSMDGDSAAAMRYTEAKLSSIAEESLFDIDKDTVNFIPNYDGSHKEPLVLPAKLPQLLLNGTMGIAVGMATNIPPHNLSELCDGINSLIDNPDCSVDDLMGLIKGPDFPTGGIIYNNADIKQAYATGKGGIIVRAKTDIIEEKNGQFKIIVSEIPYQVNKAALLEKIAELVKDKKIDGIKDLRDESSKEGVRVVIEMKKDAYPKKILNKLFKMTQLQTSFHMNMLALIDGIQPRVLTLKMVLEEYLKHRKEVIRRRTEYELAKAKERAHILEGLKIALDNIDRVIDTIKKSKDKEEAKINLMKKFKLSERQTIAILEMKLQNLANLERLKIEEELKEKKKLIKELEGILASPKKILGLIKGDLDELKEKYGDDRKTQIVPHAVGEFSQEDLVPDESMVAVITKSGYIKRLPPETFKTQGRGGKGVIGLTTKEEDVVEHFFTATTHSDILFFTTRGRVYKMKGYDIPAASRTAKGQAIINFLNLAQGENVASVMPLSDLAEYKYLAMVTELGVIKKVNISDFANIRSNGLIAIKIREDDSLEWVKATSGEDDLILATAGGQSIRFKEKNVRPMGRGASGVRAIKLKKDDKVVGMDVIDSSLKEANFDLAVVMENGFGKRTNLKNYKIQGRGGSGIKTAKITPKTGRIVASFVINNKSLEEDLIIISTKGQVIRLPLKSINATGRDTQGVRLMRFREGGDKVAKVTFV